MVALSDLKSDANILLQFFSIVYTQKKLNDAHNSENLKLMFQLQDSGLQYSKHNSTVFTNNEILNHIFA